MQHSLEMMNVINAFDALVTCTLCAMVLPAIVSLWWLLSAPRIVDDDIA